MSIFRKFDIWCENEFLSEKETVKAIVKYSQNIYELVLCHSLYKQPIKLHPEEMESILTIWANRVPKKPLSLVIYNTIDENKDIIKKYCKLKVIKEFKVTRCDEF